MSDSSREEFYRNLLSRPIDVNEKQDFIDFLLENGSSLIFGFMAVIALILFTMLISCLIGLRTETIKLEVDMMSTRIHLLELEVRKLKTGDVPQIMEHAV